MDWMDFLITNTYDIILKYKPKFNVAKVFFSLHFVPFLISSFLFVSQIVFCIASKDHLNGCIENDGVILHCHCQYLLLRRLFVV